MTKFKLYLDKDKETAWLNQMAEEGYAMTGFCAGFYTFEKCEPGEYIYQIDFGDKFFSINNDYREFMAEAGVEIIQPWGYWILLRKKAADGDFTLYTDVDSTIEHYSKILTLFKVVTIIEFICLLVECLCVADGFLPGIFFVILLSIFVFAFVKITLHTKQKIAELKERKGEPVSSPIRQGKASPLLAAGLLLNSCGLIMKESLSPTIHMSVTILAIVFMLLGLLSYKDAFKS